TADPTLTDGVACDTVGCVARLQSGSLVTLALEAEAFEEDCRRAVLIVTSRNAAPGCGATMIDRAQRSRWGAIALRRTADGWHMTPARPDGFDRPWARAAISAAPISATADQPATTPRTGGARNATPKASDLAPDD